MTMNDWGEIVEALRSTRCAQMEAKALSEVLLTWSTPEGSAEALSDQDVFGQYYAWQAVLRSIDLRLDSVAAILGDLSDRHSPHQALASAEPAPGKIQ